MLPGFRFLLAAILVSTSLLVFGVGAAALLRATHEEFVANPAWRNGPQEQMFAQATEPAQPVLAALRVEPEPPTPSLRDQVPSIGLPNEVGSTDLATSEPGSEPAVQVADARPGEAPADEPTQTQAIAGPPADVPVSQPDVTDVAKAVTETTPVATEAAPPAAAPIVAGTLEPADSIAAPAPGEAATNATKIAALAGPDAMTDRTAPPKAKATTGTPGAASKRRAHRPKKRHRVVHRPPPQPAQPAQQIYNPFAQPQPAIAATATPRRR